MPADVPSVPPPRARSRFAPAAVGVLTFLILATLALRWYQPAPPQGFAIDVVFPRGEAGRSEPLVVAGVPMAGDFFFVRYQDETTAVFGYEQWYSDPVLSAPFAMRPGEKRRLVLALPALTHVRGGSRGGGDDVRVTLDGAEVFRAPMRYSLRKASRLFFGENPIGGTACRADFSGSLFHPDGRPLRGNTRQAFAWRERVAGWLLDGKWQVAILLGLGLAAAAGWNALRAAPGKLLGRWWAGAAEVFRTHRWFGGTATVCVLGFLVLLTGGTGRVFFEERFGDFFDYQAIALLHGRLDVPQPAVAGEAFLVGGKYYGYFGLTPALLRLPLAAFDLGFGLWSRSFMLVAFAGALVAAYDVLCSVRRLITPSSPVPPPWMVVVFVLNAGLGSTLFFLGSRAYVYHEATLWGAAFALAALAAVLRYLAAPASRWWLGSLAAGLLALHARPPSGLFALVLLAAAGLVTAWRSWRDGTAAPRSLWRHGVALPLACFLGVLTFNGASYLKFGTFDGAPLKYHVQYQPARLARIDGRNFHAANLGYNFSAYAWRPNFELRPAFPYFYIREAIPEGYPEARIDLTDPTLALPYAMPGLVFLATAGAAVAAWRHAALRLPLLVLLGAMGPTAAAMLTAVAVSQRYTADFCPWLTGLAAIGLMAGETGTGAVRHAFRAIAAGLTLAAVAVTFAISLHYQGAVVWGVPADVTERYQALRKRADRFFGGAKHEP